MLPGSVRLTCSEEAREAAEDARSGQSAMARCGSVVSGQLNRGLHSAEPAPTLGIGSVPIGPGAHQALGRTRATRAERKSSRVLLATQSTSRGPFPSL